MAKKKFTKAEKKQIRKEQRQKDALRSYRFRPLKNFLFWLTGMVSCLVILVSAIFVGLKFVPISTFTGGNNEEIFSKDITSKSIIDAFMKYDTYDMSDFPIITQSIKDLAESEEVKNFVKIDTEKLSTLKFDSKFGEELASCVEVIATIDSIGGPEVLGDLGNLDVFNKWDKVPEKEMPVVDSNGDIEKDGDELKNNPALYYYKTFSKEYFRAFDNDGKREIKSIGCDLYYPNLSAIPLLDVMNVMTDSFGRLSISNLLSTFGAGDDFSDSFLGDILDGKSISDLENISGENILLVDILGEYNSDTQQMYDILCSIVNVDGDKPTYETLSVAHLQGGIDFDNLKLDGLLDEETLKLLSSGIVDKKGKPVQVNVKDLTVGHLSGVSGSFDFDNLKLDGLLDEEILDLLCTIVVVEEGEEKPTAETLTVGHLSGGLNLEGVSLQEILGEYKDNKETYDLLHSIIVVKEGETKPDADKLTVGDLSNGIDFNSASLSNFLGEYEDNKETYDLLASVIILEKGQTRPDADKLTVGDLSNGIDFNNVSLQEFLGDYDDNKETYDLLHSIIVWESGQKIPDPEDLTVGHLSNGIYFGNVGIADILLKEGEALDEQHYKNNKTLYDVLCSAVGLGDGAEHYAELKVSNLQDGLDFTNVSLSVLELEADTLDMLLKAVNASREEGEPELSKEDLTIQHISSDMFTYISLTDVLPFKYGENGNAQLYRIFLEASGTILVNPDDEAEIEAKAQNLNINNLSSFNIDSVKLNTILPVNDSSSSAKLYQILVDATGTPSNEIRIGDFKGFNINNVKLETFISESDNKIIQALITADCTVGAIGTQINQLKLYDIYGDNCFVEYDISKHQGLPRYSEENGTYLLDDIGNYTISKKAGIWLFLCFDPGEIEYGTEYADAIGCRKSYTPSTSTMGDLQNTESGANISEKITSATIRQLVDAGVLSSANSLFYTMKLKDLANYEIGTGTIIPGGGTNSSESENESSGGTENDSESEQNGIIYLKAGERSGYQVDNFTSQIEPVVGEDAELPVLLTLGYNHVGWKEELTGYILNANNEGKFIIPNYDGTTLTFVAVWEIDNGTSIGPTFPTNPI